MQSALLSCLSVCLQMEPPVALPAAVTCNKGVIAFMAMQISPADNPYEAGFSANNLKTGCNRLNWHHSRVPAHIHARHSVYNSCGRSCCTSCNANGSLADAYMSTNSSFLLSNLLYNNFNKTLCITTSVFLHDSFTGRRAISCSNTNAQRSSTPMRCAAGKCWQRQLKVPLQALWSFLCTCDGISMRHFFAQSATSACTTSTTQIRQHRPAQHRLPGGTGL